MTYYNVVGGYDPHLPVESLQGLDIAAAQQHRSGGGGGGGSNYGTLDPMELPPGHAAQPPHPADMPPAGQPGYDQQVPPQPPRDNNQMAAWYDTDL